jgi:hypothetical protein
MAIFKPAPAFEYISGAMTKPVKKGNHSHGSYLVATHRVAATENPNCQRVYLSGTDRYKRSTPPTADETLARNRFSAVSVAVKNRAKDLSKVSADQAAFMAQKDQPGGKKTMKAYLWMVEGDLYDAQHNG